MMFNETHLAKGVDAGIITVAQRDKLVELASGETSAASGAVARDEAPRFFRSFNDIFIGLGVAILGYALSFASDMVGYQAPVAHLVALLGSAVVFWLLAEWITGIRRINFPSIIIALLFSYFTSKGFMLGWEIFAMDGARLAGSSPEGGRGTLVVAAAVTAAMGLFFWRFRLPFSLLLVACGIGVTLIAAVMLAFGSAEVAPYLRWVTLAIGLAIFAVAMYFDAQDPLRTQRTSDHGFWLHLLAAPIITHSVLWNILQPIISSGNDSPEASANLMVVLVLGVFVLFSIAALIIDRRALLISSLGYAAMALGYIIYKFDIEGNVALVVTLILIAGLILTLGTGWYRLRRGLFSLLPEAGIWRKLPPVTE